MGLRLKSVLGYKRRFGHASEACLLVVAHHNLFQLAHRFDRFARPIAEVL
jgi:hypothetical protein